MLLVPGTLSHDLQSAMRKNASLGRTYLSWGKSNSKALPAYIYRNSKARSILFQYAPTKGSML